MVTELDGKVALLTGAGSLIGGAIGKKLVDAGAMVVMGYNWERSPDLYPPVTPR